MDKKEKKCFICGELVPAGHIEVGKQCFCSDKCFHEYYIMTPKQEKAKGFKKPSEADQRQGWSGGE